MVRFGLNLRLIQLFCTCFLALANLVFTTILYGCQHLSPTLSLVMNAILLLPWTISLGLLSYSMRDTLTISCTTTNWGNSTGVSVCELYKVMFSFLVISFTLQLATIAIDVSARRQQHSRGAYNAMYDSTDIKLQNRESVNSLAHLDNSRTEDPYNPFSVVRPTDQQTYSSTTASDYQSHTSRGRSTSQTGGYQNAYRQAEALEQHHADNAQEFYDSVPLPPPINTSWSGHHQNDDNNDDDEYGYITHGRGTTDSEAVAKPATPAQQYTPFRSRRNEESYEYSNVPNHQLEHNDSGSYFR